MDATENDNVLPPQLLNRDGSIRAEHAQAAIAILRLTEGDPGLLGDRQAMRAAGISDEQIAEMVERGRARVEGQANPEPPPSPEEQARTQAAEALGREQQAARDLAGAKALLRERDPGINLDNWTPQEILSEAGIQLTEAQQRDAAIDRYNARVVSDPAFAEQEFRKRALKDFEAEFPSLHPKVRGEKARDLGLTADQFNAIADTWRDRFTTRT